MIYDSLLGEDLQCSKRLQESKRILQSVTITMHHHGHNQSTPAAIFFLRSSTSARTRAVLCLVFCWQKSACDENWAALLPEPSLWSRSWSDLAVISSACTHAKTNPFPPTIPFTSQAATTASSSSYSYHDCMPRLQLRICVSVNGDCWWHCGNGCRTHSLKMPSPSRGSPSRFYPRWTSEYGELFLG